MDRGAWQAVVHVVAVIHDRSNLVCMQAWGSAEHQGKPGCRQNRNQSRAEDLDSEDSSVQGNPTRKTELQPLPIMPKVQRLTPHTSACGQQGTFLEDPQTFRKRGIISQKKGRFQNCHCDQ